MIFGYARVSTQKQVIDHQLDSLKEYGCDEIYEEKVSGTKINRPQLIELLGKLRAGDTLVVYELKRLGRNTKQLLALYEDLQAREIEFVSLNEKIDTSTPMGKFVFTQWCALAQLDRDLIAENTRAGLAAARTRGHRAGRPPLDPKTVDTIYRLYDTRQFSLSEICQQCKVSKQTIANYLQKRREEEILNGNKEEKQ